MRGVSSLMVWFPEETSYIDCIRARTARAGCARAGFAFAGLNAA